VNPEFVVAAQDDQLFRSILNKADLALPDGIGLLLAGRWLHQPLRERVTGSDFVPRFAALAARMDYRPFFLGAAPGVAERAAAKLAQQYPGFCVADCYAGNPSPDEEDTIINRVRASQPDALFVAYGAPVQDYWISRNLTRLEVPLAMGVGGTFDFIAGIVPRAPIWVQRLGLEWLFRLVNQPWRWRRQVALLEFVRLVLIARLGLSDQASDRA
jgi:N-acetylglucosaminyldiphosphoundecaprenol N-acetyl-beta-D-mannosaminyltransferase